MSGGKWREWRRVSFERRGKMGDRKVKRVQDHKKRDVRGEERVREYRERMGGRGW